MKSRSASPAEQTTLLSRQLAATQDAERRRIARDLHDQLGQRLTTLRLKLESLQRTGGELNLYTAIEDLLALTDVMDRDLDMIAWQLRPVALDHGGLLPALRSYVREWSRLYAIAADFRAVGLHRRLLPDIENCLYRISQEALTNVVKHARATCVSVLVKCRGRCVVLMIEDNGDGFADIWLSNGNRRAMGLTGMRERAASVGGHLDVEARAGCGTTISASMPAVFASVSRRQPLRIEGRLRHGS